MPEVTTEIEPSSPEPEDHRPPRRVIGGSSAGWLILAATGLFFLILASALWYALAPVTLARLVGRLAARPLAITGLHLTVDRRPQEIPAGGVLAVTPRQKIALGHLVTNRWLNYDLSLVSPDFDLAVLTGGLSAAPMSFLDPALFRPDVTLRLQALDQGRPAAEFNILVQYEARDYAAWAPLAEDPLSRMELYRKALDLDPQYPGAFEAMVASLVEAGRPDEAATIYEERLDSRPEEAGGEALTRLLEFYIGLDLSDRQPAAVERLLAWTRAQGHPAAEALRQIVEIYSRAGRLALADEVLTGLLPGAPPGEAVEIYKSIGLRSAWAGDHGKAAAAYREALKLEPEDPLTRLNLARVQGLAGRRGDYRAGLKELVDRFPDHLDYREELAVALREDGLWVQAQEQGRVLVEARPDDLTARLALMEMMEKNRDHDGLLSQYEVLTALQPDDLVALYNYGALLFDRKKPDEAAGVFQRLLAASAGREEDGAGEEEAREFLLAIYQGQGKTPEMLEQALALYRLDPSKAVYRAFILNTHENAKDWPKFAAAAEECAALNPDDPEGWLKVGAAYSRLGEPGRGREAYEKVLALDPGHKEAARALKELERRPAGGNEGRGG